jgi:hypothetical protein
MYYTWCCPFTAGINIFRNYPKYLTFTHHVLLYALSAVMKLHPLQSGQLDTANSPRREEARRVVLFSNHTLQKPLPFLLIPLTLILPPATVNDVVSPVRVASLGSANANVLM